MNRRIFLRNAALGSACIALGTGLFSSCKGRGKGQLSIALIGCGTRGMDLALEACRPDLNVKIKYVCDVHSGRSKQAADAIQSTFGYLPSQTGSLQTVSDDKEVDAVLIATPDHWHALATVNSCKAGKDVYVEATPGLNLWEGKKMLEAANKYGSIVQTGFQHRSSGYVRAAREYIKSGKLGQVVHVKTFSMRGGTSWTPEADSLTPEGLDWNAWLGPAPELKYNPGIFDLNTRGGWTNYWAYSGGILGYRASHVLDIARMVAGDPGHPQSVYCWGGNKCYGSNQEVPEMQVVTYHYDKFTMTCETGSSMNYMRTKKADNTLPDWMRSSDRVEVYGTKGLMYIGLDGRGFQVVTKGEVTLAEESGPDPLPNHLKDFISCVRSGKVPAAEIQQGHLSAALVHMGNIAYRCGNQHLLFDKEKEIFIGNASANEFIRTKYREGFAIPEKIS